MEIFSKLPMDLQCKIYEYKKQETDQLVSMASEQIIQKWYKYCKCVHCTAKRGRIKYYFPGHHESFSI